MNIHGKDIKIFAANSTVRVSEQIAECLGLPLGKSEVSTFSDGEITVSLFESCLLYTSIIVTQCYSHRLVSFA